MNEIKIATRSHGHSGAPRGFGSAPVLIAALLSAAVFAVAPETLRALSSEPESSSGGAIVPPSATDLGAAFSRIPLSFAPNEGQTDSTVRFLARGNGYSLYLTDAAAVLALTKSRPPEGDVASRPMASAPVSPRPSMAVMRMELVGERRDVRVAGLHQLPGVANYFIGNDPAAWHSNIPTFARVRYSGVYPGIDLLYYGNERQLEYDFVVAPGSDPTQVQLRFAGAQELRLQPTGDLTVTAEGATVTFHRPVTYQLRAGQRQIVHSSFRLLANNTVGFALGRYDRGRALVIDPTLGYSTYLGGSGYHIPAGPDCCGDVGQAIAVDAQGNAYVTGQTGSANFPATPGAYQTSNKHADEPGNAFVSKLNASGTALVYSTYLGGSGNYWYGDAGQAIAVDSQGNAYVAGYTGSANFPITAHAYQTTNKTAAGDAHTAFVTKLNSTGTGLVYSTYLGGSGIPGYPFGYPPGDVANGLALGPGGTAFIAGTTYSSDFPVSATAYQKVNKAKSINGSNLFVSRLDPAGSALVYSTYLGGSGYNEGCCYYFSGADFGTAVAVDGNDDAYVTGYAYSQDFPVTAGAYQPKNIADKSLNGTGAANYNVVLTKLNSTGSSLIYSTYLGGTGNVFYGDQATGVAVDNACYAYVTGKAGSADFPVSKGAFQTVFKNQQSFNFNAFLTKFNPAGTELVYSTYLGGSGGNGTFGTGNPVGDTTSGVRVDESGNAVVVGTTQSADFPVTSSAFQATNHQAANAGANYYPGNGFVTKFNAAGTALIYSTYFGGSGGDAGNAIALDAVGNAYITGRTLSKDLPVSTDAFQATSPAYAAGNGGSDNAFVAKFAIGSGTVLLPTETSATANANPGPADANITFTASVTQSTACGFPPTGSVSFVIDGGAPIVVALNGSGQASYATSSLRVGSHTVAVSYSGDAQYAPSNGSLNETVIPPPTVSILPASLTFPSIAVGSASAAQNVTLKNTGGSPLIISGISLTGAQANDFVLTNTCGASLAVGASCTLSVTFKPVGSVGTNLASVSIADNAMGSPQSISLSGTAHGAQADYLGERKADYAVWRPSTGYWYIVDGAGKSQSVQWGAPADLPVIGDFDGDGRSDLAVWRPSTGNWYIVQSSNNQLVTHQWGAPTDVPVTGDFDGDGKTDIAVFRPSTGYWYIVQSSNGEVLSKQWGASSDTPVVGDFDGDGKSDIAVFRPSTGYWYIVQSSTGVVAAEQWGASTDIPVTGDFDGDGKTDIAVYRPSTGYWYIIQSSNGQVVAKQWGQTGDVPVARDYDGDGKTDLAVWRPSTGYWYVIQSSTGQTVAIQWGAVTDVPVNSLAR
jgi:hypothetical protein